MNMKNINNTNHLDSIIENIQIKSPKPTSDYSREKSLSNLFKRIHKVDASSLLVLNKKLNRYRIYLSAAAIALIVVLAGWAYSWHTPEPTFLIASNNNKLVKTISLPDGTLIKLNHNSQIIYPKQFTQKNREVILNGQAYFEVAHKKDHPFIVRIGELGIRVLGTKFTINSNESAIYATLLEGSIEAFDSDHQLRMVPNQKLTYNLTNKKMKLTELKNINDEMCWTNNIWMLSNTPLLEICQRLEQEFNVKFIIMNDQMIDKKFTGQFFTNEALDTILETMQISTSFTYERKGKHIIIK